MQLPEVLLLRRRRPHVDGGEPRLTLLRRGSRDVRAVPADVEVLTADVGDPAQVREALGSRRFDVVVSFLVFRPEQARADIETFRGRTDHYVFISSASAYQTPPARLPLTESTPLRKPFSDYSSAKIACEQEFVDA
jgi:uncharacterized protein YbjT (DUF2867 family)